MAATKAGGQAIRDKMYRDHGLDYYKRIGSLGGKASGTGGFYGNSELARRAGAIGGKVQRDNRAYALDRELASASGKKGGRKSKRS